ncbi:MAG: nucleotidyltransferase family protein, partial [Clostridia bacterium]|nr:nucleotidyltransferase family protein [Clostridia bacterium]
VVCEYNPFHFGHARHLGKTREAGAKRIVCVMSGHFMQRGEPALFSKWARAEAAVRCGADLVLELPSADAMRSAEGFAEAAVTLLLAAGVDFLSCGSESGRQEEILRAAELIEGEAFAARLTELVRQRIPYAVARQQALQQLGGDASLLSAPNDTLAVEYARTLLRKGRAGALQCVLRVGAQHDQAAADEGMPPSASVLRGAFHEGYLPTLLEGVPAPARPLFASEAVRTGGYALLRMERALLARLRGATEEELQALPDVSRDLSLRLLRAGREATSLEGVLDGAVSRHFTRSRIRRAVLRLFLGLEDRSRTPYLRVLAMNERGREILHELRGQASLPLVTKPADHRALIAEEARVGDLLGLFAGEVLPCGEDFRRSPVFVR